MRWRLQVALVAAAGLALAGARCQEPSSPPERQPDAGAGVEQPSEAPPEQPPDDDAPPTKTAPSAPVTADPRQRGSLAPLVEKLQPAVVNIYTTKLSARWNPLAPFFFPGAPQVQEQRSLGSGFIYDSSGLVVTNHHVVAKAQQVKVRLSDRRELLATFLGSDAETDIALLRVAPAENLQQVELGDSDQLRVGDWVLAIGNPFGLSQTVTVGIVSALSRTIGAGPYDDFIQTDASINPGNSGGPLFDMDGRVVGINTAIHAEGHGIGFAIPISLARPLLDQIRTEGRVVRAHLGVVIQDVAPELAQAMGLDRPHGALVATVLPGSPAAAAGIQPGDVILEFNEHAIEVSRNLPTQVSRTGVGQTVSIALFRSGQRLTVEATLASRPQTRPPSGFGPPGSIPSPRTLPPGAGPRPPGPISPFGGLP